MFSVVGFCPFAILATDPRAFFRIDISAWLQALMNGLVDTGSTIHQHQFLALNTEGL